MSVILFMNRRSFLTFAAGACGSCLIPDAIARRIRDVCLGNSQPLILAPSNPSFDLYAVDCTDVILLHLGNPEDEPEYPTLREFIEDLNYDPFDRESLRKYLIEWRCYDQDSDGPVRKAIAKLIRKLDKPIEGGERDHWLEWDYEARESTLARAFHYLCELPLDDGNSGSGFNLGDLSFVEGDRPGSNLTYVAADSLAAVASLQHRLNELDTGARIVMA
jgi:hypothetical protein